MYIDTNTVYPVVCRLTIVFHQLLFYENTVCYCTEGDIMY